jgi:putative flippase GtrA
MSIAIQFQRFFVAGGISTAIAYVVLAILVEGFHWNPVLSSATGFVISCFVNYGLNHQITFGGHAEHRTAVPRFTLLALVGLVLNTGIMKFCWSILGVHYFLAQVIATGTVFVWNFVIARTLIFR